MSVCPQKRTFDSALSMSTLCHLQTSGNWRQFSPLMEHFGILNASVMSNVTKQTLSFR